LLINSFIRPALGDTSLAQLCRQGPRPFEQLYAAAGVPPLPRAPLPRRDLHEHGLASDSPMR
jgi:hypothetical protein